MCKISYPLEKSVEVFLGHPGSYSRRYITSFNRCFNVDITFWRVTQLTLFELWNGDVCRLQNWSTTRKYLCCYFQQAKQQQVWNPVCYSGYFQISKLKHDLLLVLPLQNGHYVKCWGENNCLCKGIRETRFFNISIVPETFEIIPIQNSLSCLV